MEEGHIQSNGPEGNPTGTQPVTAIQLATLNPAEYFGLHAVGAIAPGYQGDIIVFDHLSRFQPKKVYKDGRLAAENGRMACLGPPGFHLFRNTLRGELRGQGQPNQAGLSKGTCHSKQPISVQGDSTHSRPDYHEKVVRTIQ